jgi:hypothetical protein
MEVANSVVWMFLVKQILAPPWPWQAGQQPADPAGSGSGGSGGSRGGWRCLATPFAGAMDGSGGRRLARYCTHVVSSGGAAVALPPAAPPHLPPHRRSGPSETEMRCWHENGFMVLRGYLSEAELGAMEQPIARKQAEAEALHRHATTRSNYPDMHFLDEAPGLAPASFGHPRILGAAEAALGREAVIGQFGALLTQMVTGQPDLGTAGTPEKPGAGAHYDYRPQRVVGSFLHYCFVIVPFTDYTDGAGPIVMSPGSHTQTRVEASDGRVHPVLCARVPPAHGVRLVNPCLQRGDLAVMHGFCFHHAMPMQAAFGLRGGRRHGLYMKMRAVDAPPACGPLLIPTAAHDALSGSVSATTNSCHVTM